MPMCLEACLVKQYSLSMLVARTLISWTASHTLEAWSITIMGHIHKSYSRLTWSNVLWTGSARVSGVSVQTDKDFNL